METITITMNVFGHLHIFAGDIWPNQVNPANHLSENGEPSEVYLQGYEEINNFLTSSGISPEGVNMLNSGYPVTIEVAPDYAYCLFVE